MISPRLRRIGLWLVAAIAVAVVLVFALVTVLHLPPGERWLAGKVEELSGQEVEFDGLAVDWPFTLRADYLRLRDAEGTWATATRPYLAWEPLRLWTRVLDIKRLSAEGIDVARLPKGDAAAPSGGFALPNIQLLLESVSAPVLLRAPVLGEAVGLDIGGTFQMRGGGGLVDIHMRSEGGGLVRLAGTAGRDFLDLRWFLRMPRVERWSALAGLPLAGDLEGSGLVTGRLPKPVLSGMVQSGPGQIGDFHWADLTLNARILPEQALWRFGLTAEAREPQIGVRPLPFPELTLSAAGELASETGRLRIGLARLVGEGVRLEASGVIAEGGRRADLRLEGEADGLGAWLPVEGRARGRAVLAGDVLAPDLGGRVALFPTGLATGNAMLDRVLGPAPIVRAGLHVGRNGALRVDHGMVLGKSGTLAFDGRLAGDRLALWTRLGLPDLGAAAEDVRGRAVAWARIGGTVAAPRVVGAARLEDLVVAGAPPARGDVGFDLDEGGGTLTAQAIIADQPVDASARLAPGPPLRLRELVVESRGARVTGDLALDQGVRGRLRGEIPELRPWQDLIGPLAGRVEADAVLDPKTMRLSLRGHDLAVADVPLGAGEAELRLTGETLRFVLGFQALDAAGTADLAARHATIERLSLRRERGRLELAAPTRVTWGDALILAPSTLTIGGGRIVVDGRLDQAIAAKAVLTSVPLDVTELVLPELDAVGVVDGTLSVAGPRDAPVARLDLTGRRIGFAAAARAGLGRMSAGLSGEWRDGRARLTGHAEDGTRLRVSGEGVFPLPLVPDGWLDGAIQVAGDVGRLSEALPLAGHVFAGRIDGAARLTGVVARPNVEGGADITRGRYENLENGTLVADLTGRLDLDGDAVRVEASGSDGGRGRVRLNGGGTLDGAWRGEVTLDRFTALRRDDVDAVTDGRLQLAGQGTEGRIAGAIRLPRAEIDIGRLKGSGPVTIDVVEINRPGQAVAEQGDTPSQQDETAPVELRLDVRVAVEHAFVRGRGLDSEWQGNLTIGGTLADPSVNGRLVAARGDYQFFGKSFRLTEDSAVAFDGDPADPGLDIAATARATDITARVEVGGSGRAPQLAFTSDPPLPQDEVLARLLFGRGLGQLSAFQQIQLAQMAANGLSGGDGFDPIGQVRGLFGLDTLDVGGESETGPTLSAGKYIGRDTFVRVEQGTQGLGSVTVERELGGGFSVETEVGELSGGGVGFSWRKNY